MLRLLCLVLAACALSAGGAPVAAVGNRTFDTIADALKEDGGLIVLLSDVSGSLPVNVKTAFWGGPENPVTLDLAGHTIPGTDASKPVIENNGDLTIIDSVGGGKITRSVAATDSGGGIKNYGAGSTMTWRHRGRQLRGTFQKDMRLSRTMTRRPLRRMGGRLRKSRPRRIRRNRPQSSRKKRGMVFF